MPAPAGSISALLIALAAAGCGTGDRQMSLSDETRLPSMAGTLQKPLDVARVTARAQLSGDHNGELDAASRADLDALLADHPPQRLRVDLATTSDASGALLERVVAQLVRAGVPRDQITRRQAPTAADETDVRLTASYFVVQTTGCPDPTRPSAIGQRNVRTSNFGCATSTNLGAMVADPRDLHEQRDLGSAPARDAVEAIRHRSEQRRQPGQK